jgi:cytoskeletal protein CcmA (bactofilin family)
MANIGKSIVIKGDLTGEEDLVIEGKVEGKVHLPNHRLTIGQGGNVQAEVHAKSVVVIGRVAGNVSAGERLEVQASGIVDGDVRAPRLSVQEGAVLNGSIQMSAAREHSREHAKEHAKEPAPRPVPLPQAVAAGGGEARRLV